MDAKQRAALIPALLDRAGPPARRSAAARQLASEDDAVDALLQVAQADKEDDSVAYAAGAAVAEILWRKQQVYEAPLAFFNGSAYLGFDAAVPAINQASQATHSDSVGSFVGSTRADLGACLVHAGRRRARLGDPHQSFRNSALRCAVVGTWRALLELTRQNG